MPKAKQTAVMPELLPVRFTDNGKEVVDWCPKNKYAHAVAGELAARLKVDIGKKHIVDMLELVNQGKPLQEGNEPEWQKVYDRLEKDLEEARDKANDMALEKQRAEAEAIRLKKEAEDRENSLVAIAENTDATGTFQSIGKFFDIGNMDRMVAKGNVPDDVLVQAVETSLRLDNFTNWAKGDLVLMAHGRGMEGALMKISATHGIPFGSLWRMAKTCEVVKPDMRKPGISFTTYAEIATTKFSKEEAENKEAVKELLSQIGEEEGQIKTAQQAREAALKKQGKGKAATNAKGPDMEKDSFIVIVAETGTVEISKGYPKGLSSDDAIIIHAKTLKRHDGGKKWSDLDKYEQPEPEPDQQPTARSNGATKKKKATTRVNQPVAA